MKDELPKGQMITVRFKNGKVGRFVGPAVLDRKDGVLGRIGIESIQVGPPFELSTGTFFAETRDGTVVLMKELQGDEEPDRKPN